MDISTLSKQLNIPAPQLRAKMRTAGFYVSDRANKIDNQLAKRVLNTFGAAKPAADAALKDVEIKLPKVLTVKEFAQILKLDIVIVIKKLIENGVLASINEEIDYDTAAIVATDLGYNVSEQPGLTSRLGLGYVAEVIKAEQQEKSSEFILRPPVVAIMGHVDHGKTTLLDAIRQTNVAGSEAGKITQHMGAYQVLHKGKAITFLDTPGHEAFSAMRARGANVTDIIVLVVAADDGVKPQTIEVVNRAKLTATPLIVAINKIDRPDANVERVKKELSDSGVMIEEWGGEVPVAKISALSKQGISELLDLILLQAEIMDLKANPKGQLLGTVIEAHLSRTKGPIASVLLQNGTLELGAIVAAGKSFGKIRSMEDEHGKKIKVASLASTVAITGLSEVPTVGDILKTYAGLEEAKRVALAVARTERAKRIQAKSPLMFGGKDLNLIIRVDVLGSLEAINEALAKLKSSEVKLNILEEGTGEINETDVTRAKSAGAVIIGFHTKITPAASKLAASKNVPVQLYEVIYELVEDLTRQVVELLTPEVLRAQLGRAKVLAVFRTEKDTMIIGGQMAEGKIKEGAAVEIKRGGEVIGQGEILELQQNKVRVNEVLQGLEFGVKLRTTVKIEPQDLLIVFEETVRKKNYL